MRVLVIDDDTILLHALELALRDRYDVRAAQSASEAFAKLAEEPFDAIVCDVHLPDIDGRAFVDKLSRLDASRVIFMTGSVLDRPRGSLAEHRVLTKPFTQTQLAEAIDEVGRDAA
jgi:CheY-like chemotaxis protein